MRTKLLNREVQFRVEDGCLVRIVTGSDGRTYTHRCAKHAFEAVAHALASIPAQGDGTTLRRIVRQESLPHTQVNVALGFLDERGLVDVRHRRSFPATQDVYLDAMVEYHALAEEPTPA